MACSVRTPTILGVLSGLCVFLLWLSFPLSSKFHSSAVVVNAWVHPLASTNPSSSSWRTLTTTTTTTTTSLFTSSSSSSSSSSTKGDKETNDEKIAQLEANLRTLKEEQQIGDGGDAEEEDEDEEAEAATMDMVLSEGWKQARESYDPKNTATVTRQTEEQKSTLGLVTKVVGGLVALIVFSQIPVGQEGLSKYSANTSGPTKATIIDLGDRNPVYR